MFMEPLPMYAVYGQVPLKSSRPKPAWQVFEGEGEGNLGRETTCERGGRRFLSFLPHAPHALSHAQILPSPSPFNACHTGYLTQSYVTRSQS